jgi:hypothetical protein
MALPMEDEALVLTLIEQMRESGEITAITAGCICRIIKRALPTSRPPSGSVPSRCLAMNPGGYVI